MHVLKNFRSILVAFALVPFIPAIAQNTVITYQGHVTTGGTNFTGSGQFKFAIVTSTNANQTATATASSPSGGYITAYTVTFGGSGYVTAPTVTIFGGGGTGAAAHANINSGSVTSITVDNPGYGNYTSAPAVLIAPPPANISYTTYWSNDGASVNGSEPSASVFAAVTNGLFNVALGDNTQPNMLAIPASLFTQSNLQLRVWFNDGTHGFAALDPAQNLTPAPYAAFANNASFATAANTAATATTANTANNVPASGLSGTYSNALTLNNAANNFSGNGSGLTSLNAGQLTGQVPSTSLNNTWKVNGNTGANPGTGAFIGTADNNPLEFKVNGLRTLRIEPTSTTSPQLPTNAPNLIGGSSGNTVSSNTVGATIAGGGAAAYSSYSNAYNSVAGDFGSVGGGMSNNISSQFGTVGGGYGNQADYGGTVGGGYLNNASGDRAVVAGGYYNWATNYCAAIAGGQGNSIADTYGSILGGTGNVVGPNGYAASIGGGFDNTANGFYATVPGGINNVASGLYSFAGGGYAQALHDGCFVWNANYNTTYASTGNYQFCVKADGGLHFTGNEILGGDLSFNGGNAYHNLSMSGGNSTGYLYASYPALGDGIHLGYNYYWDSSGAGHIINTGGGTSRISASYSQIVLALSTAANANPNTLRLVANATGVTVYGTFNNSSDRNVKQDISPINATEILERVTRLPVTEWSYKDDPKTRHIGPMGQDFYAAFNIGTDDKHIAPIDEAGVAFASIQALNDKVKSLTKENDDLKSRLEKLEKALTSLTDSKK